MNMNSCHYSDDTILRLCEVHTLQTVSQKYKLVSLGKNSFNKASSGAKVTACVQHVSLLAGRFKSEDHLLFV